MCCLLSQAAVAETVYVRDTIYVPLRGGQSTGHRILHRGIRSGTKLEKLETNEETGYTRVRMENGLEGWIQSQYLVEEPIARDLLADYRTKLDEVETAYQKTLLRIQELEQQLSGLDTDNDNLREKNRQLQAELDRITALAADVINIDEENRSLKSEHESLLTEIDELSVANQRLQDTSNQQWFLRGAGVVVIGLLLGFWFARRIYHRRNNSGWA